MWESNTYIFQHTYEGFINVPATSLVLIDRPDYIEDIGRLVKIYMRMNSASKPVIFPGYVLVTPWMIRRTYFFSIFVRKLA